MNESLSMLKGLFNCEKAGRLGIKEIAYVAISLKRSYCLPSFSLKNQAQNSFPSFTSGLFH